MALITVRPESSNIAEYSYDDQKRTLRVRFKNGNRYTHGGISDQLFQNMRKYRSAGEFYHGLIRNREVIKVEIPSDYADEGNPAPAGGTESAD